MPKTDMTVANTILAQLGGRRLRVMTGAHTFVGGDNFLMFALPRSANALKGINKVRIDYSQDRDLYTMELFKITKRTGYLITKLHVGSDLDVEGMRAFFESTTGLRLTL